MSVCGASFRCVGLMLMNYKGTKPTIRTFASIAVGRVSSSRVNLTAYPFDNGSAALASAPRCVRGNSYALLGEAGREDFWVSSLVWPSLCALNRCSVNATVRDGFTSG